MMGWQGMAMMQQQQQQQQMAAQMQQMQQSANNWQTGATQQSASSDEGVGQEPNVDVQGCTHVTVGGIIRGSFTLSSENHGRPAYKRNEQVNGLDVMIYYWDERDGASFNGWWFGPKIGGDQVWAYHPGKHIQTPPKTGWKVPYDGPIDTSIVLTGSKTVKPAGVVGGGWNQGNMTWQQQQAMQTHMPSTMGQNTHADVQLRALEEAKKNQQTEQQKRISQFKEMQEQKRKQAEEQQAKIAQTRMEQEQKNKMQMEDLKRKAEEFRNKQEEERKRKVEELKAKQEEQRAAFAIRRVLQKVRVCTLDNFEELCKELEEVSGKELPACGSQQETVKQESENGVAAARERVDKIREARAKEEERKAEIERKAKEMQEKADALVGEFKGAVEEAEEAHKELIEETDSLEKKAVSEAKFEKALKSLESSTDEARQKAKGCQDFITEHATVLKGQKSLDGKAEVAKLMTRVNSCKREIDLLAIKQTAVKKKCLKKVDAAKLTESLDGMFKRSDKDRDGCLSKTEIKTYCKVNHSFTVSSDIIEDIFDSLVEAGTKGVKRDKFQRLRVMVGVARELGLDSARRKKREAAEAVLKKAEDAFLASVEEYKAELEAAEKAAEEADQHSKVLNSLPVRSTSSKEMKALLEKGEALNKAAEEAHVGVKEALPKLRETEPAEQLKKVISKNTNPLQERLSRLPKKLLKCTGVVDRFQKTLHEKVKAELAELRKQCLELLWNHKAANKLSNESLFKAIDTKKDGKIDCSEFVKFMPKCERKKRVKKTKPPPVVAGIKPKEKADKSKKGSKAKAKAKPKSTMKICLVGQKADEKEEKEGETQKEKKEEETKEEEKEEEKKEGETKEDGKEDGAKDEDKKEEKKEDDDKKEDAKEKDDDYEDIQLPLPEKEELERCFKHLEVSEPIFTLEAFERLMRLCMRVTKETVCTKELAINSETLRRLELGEVIEVLDGPVADGSVSVERVRARLVKDMQEAWVTMTGNQGTVFLVPGGDKFKIVKETLLTEAFELDDSSGDDRKLKMGEIVEVIEWPTKGDSSTLTRMRCRALKDGKVGWATTVGNTGNVFLQAI